jgi:hypothetical protein
MRFTKDNAPEEILFNGIVYRRMGGKRRYWLSMSRSNEGRRHAKGLHVAIWEHHNGRNVPPLHDVHHRDHDVFNFEPDNLECLPRGVHRSMAKVNIDREAMLANLDKQRPKASEWHKSEAGREWHKQVTAKFIPKALAALALKPKGDDRPVLGTRICEWCGSKFEFRNKRKILCSPKCQLDKSHLIVGRSGRISPYYASRLQSDG